MTRSGQHPAPRPDAPQSLALTWSSRTDTRGDLRVIRAVWSATRPLRLTSPRRRRTEAVIRRAPPARASRRRPHPDAIQACPAGSVTGAFSRTLRYRAEHNTRKNVR